MDGLEAREIKLSDLLKENLEFRVDSEYVLKEYLKYDKMISDMPFDYIDNIAFVTDGIHTSIDFDENSNINLISAKAPKQNVFDLSLAGYISEEQNKLNPRTQLQEDDIIISTVGTIGNCAVVDKSILPANSDRHVGIIRINKKYKSRYVSTFLLSKYGRFQTQRHTTGNVQPNLFIYKIKALKIPFIGDIFQEIIENKVIEAHHKLNKSKDLYLEAEDILLNEIGMKNFQESEEKVAVKSFTESFGVSGRLDAEYYQKKYDDLFEILAKNNTKKLVDIVDIKKSVEPGSDFYREEGTPFIRVANLFKYEITKTDIYLNKNDFPKGYLPKPKKDTILLSKDGSVGIAYKVDKDEDFVTSGAILHLTVKEGVLPDYLTLVLNSKITSLQAEKDAGGSIIKHWKPSEIAQVVIPILSIEVQQELSEKIKESFELRQQSKTMLNKAKTAVEIAIEQNEKEAIKYLNA